MPSIVGKRRDQRTYYYLVGSARVDGKPRIVSQEYLGTAEEVMAKLAGSVNGDPVRTQHKQFGDLAAVWSMLERLGVARVIDEVAPRYDNAGASVGTYYIDSGNERAPIAQRGKAKQKHVDLRLVGLALVVTRDGGVPVVSHAYPGDRPDVSQFGVVIDELVSRYRAVTESVESLTVVYDAGQNSRDNHATVEEAGLGFVGSLPPSDHPDPLTLPRKSYVPVDEDRYPGVSCVDTEVTALGVTRRAVLTHSPTLHAKQSRGFDQTLAKARKRLAEPQARLARGKTRRGRDTVEADIAAIVKPRWVGEVLTVTLTGTDPTELRLTWRTDQQARKRLEDRIFGKRILFTNRTEWSTGDVVAAYRSQSEVEAGFRQQKDPHVVSFGPMHHWTDQKIRVHVFYSVPALTVAHLMRREADRAGLHMSVRELLTELAGIGETVLLYHDGGKGRPRARRKLTDTTPTQQRLADIFDVNRYAPAR